MARYVPSQEGNVTHDLFVTLLYRCHLSIASRGARLDIDFRGEVFAVEYVHSAYPYAMEADELQRMLNVDKNV
jgi:hypothetical protein